MTAAPEPHAETVMEIVRCCEPHLGGHPPAIQGAALADLLATWLVGHEPAIRDSVMIRYLALVH